MGNAGNRGTGMNEATLKAVRDMVNGVVSNTTSGAISAHQLPPTSVADAQRTVVLKFLRTVLPENGPVFFAFTLPARRHYPCRSLDGLAQRLMQLDVDTSQQTYFATAAYGKEWVDGANGEKRQRVSENVVAARSFWIDIDVGDEKGAVGTGYKTAEEAGTAIEDFSSELGINPTLVIDSGRGRHVYFAVTESVPPAEWKRVARALKHACILSGLRADPSRTEDIASVLRPVTCTHRKDPSNPKQVTPLAVGTPISFSEFEAALQGYVARSQPTAPPSIELGGSPATAAASSALAALNHATRNEDLSAGIREARHWILSLPADDQIRILDSACAAIPETLWSQYDVWCGIMVALRGLDHLDEGTRLALLQRHSERSAKWGEDGWTPERLRTKFRTFSGGSVRRIFDFAEAHGWKESDSQVLRAFNDSAAAEAYLVDRFIYVTDQGGYFDTRSRQLITPTALNESQSWLTSVIGNSPRSILRISANTRRADTQGYHPGSGAIYEEHGRSLANLYVPWSPARLAPLPDELELWRWFIEDHLFKRPEDGPARDYFLNVLAYPLQNPGRRVASVPLLIGEVYGSGKSTLFERVPRLVFGTRNVTVATQGELESGFNDWHANAQIVCFPEIWMGASREAERLANDLKDKITSDVLRVYPKGLRGYSQTNRATLLATSNHEDAVYLREGDRRWGVHVTDAPKMATADADRLYAFLESGRAAGVLREILLLRDLSRFSPSGEPPMTTGKQIAITASRSPLVDELVEAIDNRELPFCRDLVTIDDIQVFLQRRGYRRNDISPRRIALALKASPISAVLLGRKRIHAGLAMQSRNGPIPAAKRNVWCLRGVAIWCNASESMIAKHFHDGSPAFMACAPNGMPSAQSAAMAAGGPEGNQTPASSPVTPS